MDLKRRITLINLFLARNGRARAEYIRKKKLFFNMGEHCYYHPWKIPHEGYLMNIHNNVYIATNVAFLTHDVMDGMFNYVANRGYQQHYEYKQFIGSNFYPQASCRPPQSFRL